MTQRDKLLRRIRNNPKDVTFHDLRQLLELFGFQLHTSTGSHHTFKRKGAGGTLRITIPYKRRVKVSYVRRVLAMIDEIIEEQEVGGRKR